MNFSQMLADAEILEFWINRVREEALSHAMSGNVIPGYSLRNGRSRTVWRDEDTVKKALQDAGLPIEEFFQYTPISVTSASVKLKKFNVDEFLGEELFTSTASKNVLKREYDE